MDTGLAISGLFNIIRLAGHPEEAFPRKRFGGDTGI
jgi:hypothetical protein